MAQADDVRRRILVARAIAAVGKDWEYYGKIADTRGFGDRAAGTIDKLLKAGVRAPIRNATGRLADVGRLLAGYLRLDPDAKVEPEPEARPSPTIRPSPQ